jgi:hypothetical protein
MFAVAAFRGGFRPAKDEVDQAYSEQASKAKHNTSRIVSRELEEAVFRLEDNYVQKAFEIYCDETPERDITDPTLLWMVYTAGLCRFIEDRILRDICFKLDQAQPSLELNILRPDRERLFSYQSEKLKREFPIVFRLVERLKAEWGRKIAARVAQLTQAVSTQVSQSPSEVEQEVEQTVPLEELDLLEPTPATETPIFVHSENYDSITFNGKSYTLQERQAAVVKLLHEALRKGHPAVPGRRILNLPGCADVGAIRDIFKSRPQLWGTLIVNCEVMGEGRGFYRLNPSIKA